MPILRWLAVIAAPHLVREEASPAQVDQALGALADNPEMVAALDKAALVKVALATVATQDPVAVASRTMGLRMGRVTNRRARHRQDPPTRLELALDNPAMDQVEVLQPPTHRHQVRPLLAAILAPTLVMEPVQFGVTHPRQVLGRA